MLYIFELILVMVNLTMAFHHWNLIDSGKKIYHGLWGGLYLIIAGCLAYCGKSWELMAISLFLRKIVFDLSLNHFRDLPVFYVSTKTTSLIDQLHNKLFGKSSEIYMTIYFIIVVYLNFKL